MDQNLHSNRSPLLASNTDRPTNQAKYQAHDTHHEDQPKTLLSLPLEIRTQIWAYYVDLHLPRYCAEHHAIVSACHPNKFWCRCSTNRHIANSDLHLGLCRVNRQLHAEISAILNKPQQIWKRRTALVTAELEWLVMRKEMAPSLRGAGSSKRMDMWGVVEREMVLMQMSMVREREIGEVAVVVVEDEEESW